MTEASTERALGQVEGKLDLVIAGQEKAEISRKLQYDRQDKTDLLLQDMQRKLDSVDERLRKVEEPVADFNRWRERGVGAIMLVSFAAASIGGMAVAWGKKIWAVLFG